MSKSTADNVVHFDEKLRSEAGGSQSKRLTLLNKCKDIAARHLERSLPRIMDKVDDALFDLASHAADNQEQRLYFETMREVRFKRTAIEQGCVQAFTTSASEAVARLHKRRSAAPALESTRPKLDLVEEEDFEETLAITNMVQKIRTRCLEQLYALEQRVAKLGKRDEIEPEDDPYGPEIICNAFKTSCSAIDASIDIRLLILKLFDQQVVGDLEKLYEELNDALARCGVLPEIRHFVRTDPRAGTAKPRGLVGDSLDSAAPSTTYDRGREDEAALETYEGSGAASTGARLLEALNRVMNINGTGPDREKFGEEELRVIGSLTALQQNPSTNRPELGSFDTTGVHTGTENVLRELKSTDVAQGMREVDIMMFDVVAMMFDFILDDRDMPAGMKALIGRLQIPVLKVALIDKSFFARKFHPARRLLNTLAEAASGWGWEEEVNDVVYQRAESLVMRILDEFDDRIELFEEVLEELESFLEEQERSVEKNATVSVGKVEGRERLAAAKRNAAEQIERRLAATNVHHLVKDFVSSHWKELLFIRYFEEGEHGDGWKEALQSLDDLLWSVAPKTLPEDRKHLSDLLPGLLRRLRDGMAQLAIPVEARSRFLGIFKQLHIAAIRNEPSTSGELPAPLDDGETPSLDLTARVDDLEAVDDAGIVRVEEISLLETAIEKANREIHETAETHPECAGMGTTILAAHFNDDRVTVANVGDSRMYRLRDDALERMTTDHSLRQHLIDKGFYTPQEADENIQNNVVTRAVGADRDIDVDVQELAVEPGDVYLLCSDGLTDIVSDADIGAILRESHHDLPTAVRELVDLANGNGGWDNISVVLVRVLGAPYDAAKPGEAPDASAFVEMEGITDVGLKRSHNEDNVVMDHARGIAIVADGMGGCNAGEVASEMAARIVLESLRTGTVAVEVAPPPAIRNAPASNARQLSDTTAAATALLDAEAADPPEAPHFDDDDDSDEHLELVQELEVGSWVEFYRDQGGQGGAGTGTRARLSWVSPETGRYLFTDRTGMKVADATAHGLAAELRRGGVALVEQVPLFDRIMVNITDHLRSQIPAG